MLDFLRKYLLRDLYEPHTWWGFDGPYSRVQLDDGSTFVTIMSSVWRAKTRPQLCHVGYYPTPSQSSEDKNEIKAFSCDFFPDSIIPTRHRNLDKDGTAAFELEAAIPEQDASFHLDVKPGHQRYHHQFLHPETKQKLDIRLDITQATPHSVLGPMWIARFLPIPLKWHIFSTRSRCQLTVKEGDKTLMQRNGLCHQEKNWGIGFPTAWIWCQGFPSSSIRGSLAIAGGAVTPFLNAFMVAYRSPTSHRNWNFGPASTMGLFGYGPLTELSKCDSKSGQLELVCSNPFLGRKVVISAEAPVDSFKIMSAPLPRGHTTHYCHESFIAKYKVECYERGWFSAWKKVEETILDNAALEYGGSWDHWWLEVEEKQRQGKHE